MNRRDQAIRSFIRTALALLGALFVLGRCVACAALTPAEQATVARDSVTISMCAESAHLCKLYGGDDSGTWDRCWDEYVKCKTAHGFDGGAR